MGWSNEKNSKLVKLHSQGYPDSFIARWLDTDAVHVRNRLEELGLVRRKRQTRSGAPMLPSLHALYRRAANGWSPGER